MGGRNRGLRTAPSELGPGRSGELFGHPVGHGAQRPVQRGRVAAAGLGKIGPAAALAADLLGDAFDQVAGTDPVGVVSGDTRREPDLAVVHRAHDNDAAFELVLETIDGVPERLCIGAVHAGGQHLDAGNFPDVLRMINGLAGDQRLPGLGQLAFEMFGPLQ